MYDLVSFSGALRDLGHVAWSVIWVPTCIWTAVVLTATAAFRIVPDALPPASTYRFQQALLAALPIGILGGVLIDLPIRAQRATELPLAGVPGTSLLPGVTIVPDGYAVTWAHAVGALTLLAAGTAILATARLFQRIRQTRLLSQSILHETGSAADSTADAERSLAASTSALNQRVERLRHRLRVRRPARLFVSSMTSAPMLVPGSSPLLVLPEWMVNATSGTTVDDAQIEMSLAHELVHLRRYDDWAALAERGIAAIASIHPLVHTLVRDIRLSRERACDATVLQTLQCQRGSYARLLTSVAQQSSPLPAVTLSESTSSLEQRLQTMTQSPHISNSTMVRLLTCGVFALLILGMTACADSPSSTTPDSSASEASEASSVETTDKDNAAYRNPALIGDLSSIGQRVEYPESAAQEGVQGKVFVQFTVTKDGSVSDAKVARGVSPELDAEAVRVVETLSFEPATQNGEAVPAKMTFPITFKLPSDEANEQR